MDLKSLFKRKGAADAPANNKPDTPKTPAKTKKIRTTTLSKNARNGLITGILLLVALLAGLVYVMLDPDLSREYADFIPFSSPAPAPSAPLAPAPAAPTTSAVANTALASSVSAASSVEVSSAVSAPSLTASAVGASDLSSASAILPISSAASAVEATASPPSDMVPAFPESAPIAAPAAKPRSVAVPAKSRDMRHCLSLKTDAEVMRCVYPRH